MWVQGDAGGELAARSTGARAGTTAHVGVARAYDAVVDVVLGVDVDRTGGLDHGGVALVAGGNFCGRAELRQFSFGHADKIGHSGLKTAQIIGGVARAFEPVLVGKITGRVVQPACVAGSFGAKYSGGFGFASLDTAVGQVDQRSRQIAAGGDGAALVQQVAAVDAQIAARRDT